VGEERASEGEEGGRWRWRDDGLKGGRARRV
jgi:hypothetical protein